MASIKDIDRALAEHDFDSLAHYILDGTRGAARLYLANSIRGLLTGQLKLRGRPRKSVGANYMRRVWVGERIWRTKRRHKYPKVESAVAHVAEELGYGKREAWKCWRAFTANKQHY
jgi:hypothetical protein